MNALHWREEWTWIDNSFRVMSECRIRRGAASAGVSLIPRFQ